MMRRKMETSAQLDRANCEPIGGRCMRKRMKSKVPATRWSGYFISEGKKIERKPKRKNKKKKSELILPGKQNYESVIDVSWTVTLIGYDITLPVYNRLCEIIDDYFEQGIACLERGTREHRLHIQCTGTLYYTNNEKSVKDLGLEFRRELMM